MTRLVGPSSHPSFAALSDRQRPPSRSGLEAPLGKVVTLSAAHGCDDQATTRSDHGGTPTSTTTVHAGAPGRPLSEEITVPASDQQSRHPLRRSSRRAFSPRTGSAVARAPHSLGF